MILELWAAASVDASGQLVNGFNVNSAARLGAGKFTVEMSNEIDPSAINVEMATSHTFGTLTPIPLTPSYALSDTDKRTLEIALSNDLGVLTDGAFSIVVRRYFP